MIISTTHTPYLPRVISHHGPAFRRPWVPHRRQQELPSVHPVCIVACPGGLIHQHPTRISRIRPASEYPRTSGDRFKRSRRRTLEVSIVKRVGNSSSQQSCQVNDHSINSDISVRSNQRWRLRAVNGLMERPSTLSRTLSLRVPDPHVSRTGFPVDRLGRRVGPAPAHAKSIDGDVFRSENDVDGVQLVDFGSQSQ